MAGTTPALGVFLETLSRAHPTKKTGEAWTPSDLEALPRKLLKPKWFRSVGATNKLGLLAVLNAAAAGGAVGVLAGSAAASSSSDATQRTTQLTNVLQLWGGRGRERAGRGGRSVSGRAGGHFITCRLGGLSL